MTPEQRKTQLEAAERRYQDEVANILDHHRVITGDGYLGRQDLIDEYCAEFNGMSKTIKEQRDIICALESGIDRKNKTIDDGGCAGLQDLIDEYGEEFNKMSKTIKDQKTVIAHREQTIERLYKSMDACRVVVREQRDMVRVLKLEVDQKDKTIDELRKLVNSTGEDRNRWMDKSRRVNEIRAERDRFKHDSEVLMGIVGIVREADIWHSSRDMGDIADALVDYLKPVSVDGGHVSAAYICHGGYDE